VNRPAMGVRTYRPEEPYVKGTSTVLWELGRVTVPGYPTCVRHDVQIGGESRKTSPILRP